MRVLYECAFGSLIKVQESTYMQKKKIRLKYLGWLVDLILRRELKFFAGVAIGIAIGAATGNLGIGIGIGIAFGAALSQTKNKQKSTKSDSS